MFNNKIPDGMSPMYGGLLSILATLDAGDLIKSVVLRVVGTVVSFIVSRVLKRVFG